MSFSAMFGGWCDAGDDPIRPGDQITPQPGGYAHLRCIQIDDEPPARKTERPCPSCHLIHAGECF